MSKSEEMLSIIAECLIEIAHDNGNISTGRYNVLVENLALIKEGF